MLVNLGLQSVLTLPLLDILTITLSISDVSTCGTVSTILAGRQFLSGLVQYFASHYIQSWTLSGTRLESQDLCVLEFLPVADKGFLLAVRAWPLGCAATLTS